jgi:hypothetical protein
MVEALWLHYSTLKEPKEAIYIKDWILNSCFAKLRAISNLVSFLIHPSCVDGNAVKYQSTHATG